MASQYAKSLAYSFVITCATSGACRALQAPDVAQVITKEYCFPTRALQSNATALASLEGYALHAMQVQGRGEVVYVKKKQKLDQEP
jgi:hypothetical protein